MQSLLTIYYCCCTCYVVCVSVSRIQEQHKSVVRGMHAAGFHTKKNLTVLYTYEKCFASHKHNHTTTSTHRQSRSLPSTMTAAIRTCSNNSLHTTAAATPCIVMFAAHLLLLSTRMPLYSFSSIGPGWRHYISSVRKPAAGLPGSQEKKRAFARVGATAVALSYHRAVIISIFLLVSECVY